MIALTGILIILFCVAFVAGILAVIINNDGTGPR